MRERAKRFVGNSLAATLGANVFTLPLVLAHFGWASLWSPLSNLVVLWVLPLLLPLGLLCALLGILSLPLALPFAAVTARLTGAVIWLIKALARLPQARLTDSVVTLWWLALAYLTGVLLLSGRLKGGRKWAAVSLLAVSCLLCLLPLRDTRLPAGAVRLDLLDVGQGQCVLLTTREKTIVIDCGSQQYKADTALPERLEQLHRDHVDCLILTHYDSDHINGVPSLLERCPVERMLLPVPEQEDEPIQAELLQRARSHGTHITEIHQDTTLLIQPLTLSVTHIGAGSNGGLAILATSGAFDLLVTGDADMDGEEELLRQWQLPAVEVLVAGHHGSRYSTGEALLRQARPEAVLISVGENDYGHPAQEVLERCEAAGAQIWRTDESGTLTVQYDPGT
jgi:competence protein ComEC